MLHLSSFATYYVSLTEVQGNFLSLRIKELGPILTHVGYYKIGSDGSETHCFTKKNKRRHVWVGRCPLNLPWPALALAKSNVQLSVQTHLADPVDLWCPEL